MTAKKDLLHQKFGFWTVIAQAPNIIYKSSTNKPKQGRGWLCHCECGIEKVVDAYTLTSGNSTSCGCKVKNRFKFTTEGLSIQPNTTFNRLTTIKYQGNSEWLCRCECGNNVVVATSSLNNGCVKSCGCLRAERAGKLKLQHHPRITSARACWQNYCRFDKNLNQTCTLTFDRWYQLSQEPCYYCGIKQYSSYNFYSHRKRTSKFAKENGTFKYNGIDRVLNTYHYLENCVACCKICNYAKSKKTTDQFYAYIDLLQCPTYFELPIQLLPLPEYQMLRTVKKVYQGYEREYGQMEIDLITFYSFSQLPCFYCSRVNINHQKSYDKKMTQAYIDKSHYQYNGIDRLNSFFGHYIYNIVPSCIDCNITKSNLTIHQWYEWIKRVKAFQQKKKELDIAI